MANTATVIVLTAGAATFTNEWYQTKKIDWKVPVATVLAAGAMDVVSRFDQKSATLLSVMVLIAALSTKFNGKSAIDTVTTFAGTKTGGKPQVASKVRAV